jgi:hypothetical protein
MQRFLFPRWTNSLVILLGLLAAGGAVYAGSMFMLVTDDTTLNVGYAPEQPVPFSHAIHAGQLKMDCRYCHTTVFDAAHAAIPPTATCVNCHSPVGGDGTTALAAVHASSTKLASIHESWKTGKSVAWKKVHNTPDFVYFNHAAHVNSGVSCVSCHDRIDKMERVYQAKTLSMDWCLECHRDPDPHLRPKEFVTKLDWQPPAGVDAREIGKQVRQELKVNPQTHCGVCHR